MCIRDSSITMLHAFKNLQIFYPKKFDIIAVSVNPGRCV